MLKNTNIPQERLERIAMAGGKHIETHDYCGAKDPTAGIVIANVNSEERYRDGNNGRDKFDLTPGTIRAKKHQQSGRTPEQIIHHNEKMAARREAHKTAREAAGIVPAYRQNLLGDH